MYPFYTYDPLLCPRCTKALTHINEAHLNAKMLPCRAKKIREPTGFVYLMHDVTNDLLKIGYSIEPQRRHKELVHGSTNEIKLLGFFIGSKTNEHIVHALFKSARVKREWFRHETQIIDYFTNHPAFLTHDEFGLNNI